jgi:hypothetical protein
MGTRSVARCSGRHRSVGPERYSPSVSAEADDLQPLLERMLAKVHGNSTVVSGWRREPSSFAVRGLFPIDVLHVSLAGGREVAVFVKHLGPEQADHPDKQCRDREQRVYENLLVGDGLPVPRYYGSRWNAATHRCEVYLEYIGDWSLKYQDLDNWFPAARRLAQLHVYFLRRAVELSSCDYLLRLDAQYFRRWAERAQTAVARQAPGSADELASVVTAYGPVADTLARQPVTLVHNDLSPKNVLADRSYRPARICFVDWEMAGIGCGLLDLVHLKHGLDPADDRAMCEAYLAEVEGIGLLPSNQHELRRLFVACELHHTLYRLAHVGSWRLPQGRAAEWVAEARELSREFRREGTP